MSDHCRDHYRYKPMCLECDRERHIAAYSLLAQAPGSEDDAMGMTWWNVMSQPERHEVLRQGGALIRGVSVAQAWRLWKAGRISMTAPNSEVSSGAKTP